MSSSLEELLDGVDLSDLGGIPSGYGNPYGAWK